MNRLLANTAFALSLALFVSSVAFWVRSNVRWDIWQWRFHSATERTFVDVLSTCNVLRVGWDRTRLDPPSAATPQTIRLAFGEPVRQGVWWHSQPVRQRYPLRWRTLGFWYTAGRSNVPLPQVPATVRGTGVMVVIPYWSLALVTGVLPALRLRRWLRGRKRAPGTCPRCGYDLRATPGRCPECGRAPPKARRDIFCHDRGRVPRKGSTEKGDIHNSAREKCECPLSAPPPLSAPRSSRRGFEARASPVPASTRSCPSRRCLRGRLAVA